MEQCDYLMPDHGSYDYIAVLAILPYQFGDEFVGTGDDAASVGACIRYMPDQQLLGKSCPVDNEECASAVLDMQSDEVAAL